MAQAIARSRGNALVAVASREEGRTRAFAKRHGVPFVFASYRAMLAYPKIDAVCIATPNFRHAREAISAFKAGKHVFVEKPMALSRADGDAMVRAALRARRHLAVGFHLRVRPSIQKARALIQSGAIGDILEIDLQWSIGREGEIRLPPLPAHQRWREKIPQSGGGALMSRGVHLFDLIRFLTGCEIEEVIGTTAPAPARGVDQSAWGIFRAGRTVATVATSRMLPHAPNEIHIFGTRGRMILRDALAPSQREIMEYTRGATSRTIHFPPIDAYRREIEDFASAVRGRASAGATGADGARCIAVTEAFLHSARTGRSARVASASRNRA